MPASISVSMYLYPQNLRARPHLGPFSVIHLCELILPTCLAFYLLARLSWVAPLSLDLVALFLCLEKDDVSIGLYVKRLLSYLLRPQKYLRGGPHA